MFKLVLLFLLAVAAFSVLPIVAGKLAVWVYRAFGPKPDNRPDYLKGTPRPPQL